MTTSAAVEVTKNGVAALPQTTTSIVCTAGIWYLIAAMIEYSANATTFTPQIDTSLGETSAGSADMSIINDGTRTANQLWGASTEKRVIGWQFKPSSTGARTFTLSSALGTGVSYHIMVISIGGADPTTPFPQVQTTSIASGTTPTVTMPVAFGSATNGTFYFGSHRQTGTPSVTAPLTSLTGGQTTNANGLSKVGFYDGNDTTPDVVFSASGRGAAFAVEVKEPVVAVDVVIPVYLDVAVAAEDYPEVDPEEPPVEEEETPPDVVDVPVGAQQSPGARPNTAREMELPRMLADMLAAQRNTVGQGLASHGSLPHVDADPEFPQNGMAWVRSDTGELVWMAGGLVYRVSTGGP